MNEIAEELTGYSLKYAKFEEINKIFNITSELEKNKVILGLEQSTQNAQGILTSKSNIQHYIKYIKELILDSENKQMGSTIRPWEQHPSGSIARPH